MVRRLMFAGFGGWLAMLASTTPQAAVPQAAPKPTSTVPAKPAASPTAEYRQVLNRYCVTCHNERLKTGNLELDKMDLAQVGQHPDVWEKVVRKLRVGMMPPAGVRRPDQATYDRMVSWLTTQLDASAVGRLYAGQPLLHRLNRAEYANAIRDLLDLEIDPAAYLPGDDSSFGFDNVADVLGVSPSLQERYITAAQKISMLAVGDPAQGTIAETVVEKGDFTQTSHIDGLPLGTRGGLLVRRTFPLDGTYELSAKIFRTNEGNIRGTQYPHTFIVTVDDEQVFEDVVGNQNDRPNAQQGGPNATQVGDAIDARWHVKVPIKAGPHNVGFTFIVRNQAQAPDVLKPFQSTFDHIEVAGVPQLESVKIAGPYDPTGPGDTPSRRRIFVCKPPASAQGSGGATLSTPEETACARTILSTLARRTYRRDVTDDDMKLLMTFYENGRKQGGFEKGVELGLRLMLATPEFAFRAEHDPANVATGAVYRINDFELASRLSYFLWSSIPDDQLLDVAAAGHLHTPAVLTQQVKRMLADPKAKALTDNFAGQWLHVRNLRGVSPVLDDFPDFDDNLRQALKTEMDLFFDSIVREDRSVLDLMTANYTFVNERLAKHYGVPNVYGSQFRRVTLTDENRFGLLGKGSVLATESRPNRTSPVLRGKFVLENILGSPPPQPPPNVPQLEAKEGEAPKTLRAQMELHRNNPTCASCHKLMDPIGFALENFDAVGMWRSHDTGNKIDASGELSDGTKVDGVISLRKALLRRPENFVQTMTEKLLIYGLGRGLDYRDMPTVRAIVRNAAKDNYRFSTLVLGVVNSTPFVMRTKPGDDLVATR